MRFAPSGAGQGATGSVWWQAGCSVVETPATPVWLTSLTSGDGGVDKRLSEGQGLAVSSLHRQLAKKSVQSAFPRQEPRPSEAGWVRGPGLGVDVAHGAPGGPARGPGSDGGLVVGTLNSESGAESHLLAHAPAGAHPHRCRDPSPRRPHSWGAECVSLVGLDWPAGLWPAAGLRLAVASQSKAPPHSDVQPRGGQPTLAALACSGRWPCPRVCDICVSSNWWRRWHLIFVVECPQCLPLEHGTPRSGQVKALCSHRTEPGASRAHWG